MIIERQHSDSVSAIIKMKLEKTDYEVKVEEALKEYRRKADMKGFRPGSVPMGLIKKQYGKAILFNQINKIISDSLNDYLEKEKLDIYGEPLPNNELKKELDLDHPEDFEFWFDIGIRPQVNLEFSKEDIIPYYTIIPEADLIDNTIESMRKQYSEMKPAELSGADSWLTGNLKEIEDDGSEKPEGLSTTDTMIHIHDFKVEETKNKFTGLKQGDVAQFNINDLHDWKVLRIFNLKPEDTLKPEGFFRFEVSKIQELELPELNHEFYKKIFAGEDILTAEEFRDKVTGILRKEYREAGDSKFYEDSKALLIQKCINEFPSTFLKRWMDVNNTSKEKIDYDKDWNSYDKLFKWLLIRENIIKNNQITVSDEDLKETARTEAGKMYRNYGIFHVSEETMNVLSNHILTDKKESVRIRESALQSKIIDYLKQNLITDIKDISLKEFNEMIKDIDSIGEGSDHEDYENDHDHDHDHHHHH